MAKGRILVVDDNESTRLILSDYFSSIGHKVVTATDGEDALKKFVPGGFDCIISDLMMPKIDGLELLKRIREEDSQVCFLMITGYSSIENAVNAIRLGADDYVNKPFHMEDFRIKMERILRDKKKVKLLKTMNRLFWPLILSIPIWLLLGIILGILWR